MKKTAILLAFMASTAAHAQDMPKFPSPCAKGDSKCELAEVGAYIAIGADWARLNPVAKGFCVYWEITHPAPSYKDMAQCLDNPKARAKDISGTVGAHYFAPGSTAGLPLPNLEDCARLRDFLAAGTCTFH